MKRVGRTPPLYLLNRAASIVGLESTCDITVQSIIRSIALLIVDMVGGAETNPEALEDRTI